jgi:hypothetical protein
MVEVISSSFLSVNYSKKIPPYLLGALPGIITGGGLLPGSTSGSGGFMCGFSGGTGFISGCFGVEGNSGAILGCSIILVI